MTATAARTVLVAFVALATPAAFARAEPAGQTATVIDPAGAITPDETASACRMARSPVWSPAAPIG